MVGMEAKLNGTGSAESHRLVPIDSAAPTSHGEETTLLLAGNSRLRECQPALLELGPAAGAKSNWGAAA